MTANPTRILAGKRAKAEGDSFEHFVEKHARISGINFVKVPMGARMVRGMGGMKMIPIRTPFDYVLAKLGVATFIDAKSTSEGTFKHVLVKEHQLQALLGLERAGFTAGYLVNFRKWNRIVFFSATQLSDLRMREGLKPEEGLCIGSLYTMDLKLILRPVATKGEV